MKHEINKIEPLSAAKLVAIVNAPFGLIHTLIGMIMLMGDKAEEQVAGLVMLFGPLYLAGFSFVATLVCCCIYNWLASKIGGIKVEVK